MDCFNNEIADLSPLTPTHIQNINELDCSGNKLTKLDLSRWVNLLYLYYSGNQLAEIDISNCESLYDFICSENLLTDLDVTHNPELYMLECSDNRLTSLDLTNNPRLEYLWCYENYMDAETPDNSIEGLEPLRDALGPPLSKDVTENNWFAYYPQNTTETEHSWDSGKITTQPSCTEKGELTYTCISCGETKTEEIAATGQHTPGPNWRTDKVNHWHTCTVCGVELDKKGHVYDDDQDTTCNICGYERVITPPSPPSPGSSSSGGLSFSGPSYRYHTDTATVGEGGKIEPSGKTSVQEKKDQTFNITPDEGYVVADVLVDGKSVGAVEKYTFEKVDRAHTIKVDFKKVELPKTEIPTNGPSEKEQSHAWNPFVDVKEKNWFHDNVKHIYEQGLMVGTDETHFSPQLDTSRAMIATILWRLSESPSPEGQAPYTDCNSEGWYSDAIAWADESGIVTGYGHGIFAPDRPISREEMAVMLWRYAGSPGTSGTLSGYTDSSEVSVWATNALCWATERGILSGRGGGVLDPKGKTTRAESAAMLQRYLSAEG